ncbi:hypothetical protein L9F63_004232, partial [Diploptera punctata]
FNTGYSRTCTYYYLTTRFFLNHNYLRCLMNLQKLVRLKSLFVATSSTSGFLAKIYSNFCFPIPSSAVSIAIKIPHFLWPFLQPKNHLISKLKISPTLSEHIYK